MGFTIHDGEAGPAETARIESQAQGRWQSVQVHWPSDLSQPMYRRPEPGPTWVKRYSGLLAAGAIALTSILTACLGASGAIDEQISAVVIAKPTAGYSGEMSKLPDFTDAYLDRHSIRPQAHIGIRSARNDYEAVHPAR